MAQLAILPPLQREEIDEDDSGSESEDDEMDGNEPDTDSNDESAANDVGDESSFASDGGPEFAQLSRDTSRDCINLDKNILPYPRYVATLRQFKASDRLCYPTQKHMEDVNLLSPFFYGPKFQRGPQYRRHAKLVLKNVFPFVKIGSINEVFKIYRQFAASFHVLDTGLRCVYQRFGVADHSELRLLAKRSERAAVFHFESSLLVFDTTNQLQQGPNVHQIKIIDRIGEHKRRKDRTTGLSDALYEVLDGSTFDANLNFECEWLVFHLTTAQLRPHVRYDARGNIPFALRAAQPYNHRPNSGWLFAFCLGRYRGEDDEIYADDAHIQCLECLLLGKFTTFVRKDSNVGKIMDHLEKIHNDAFKMVKVLSEMEFLAYLNDLV